MGRGEPCTIRSEFRSNTYGNSVLNLEQLRQTLEVWWRTPPQFVGADAPTLRLVEPVLPHLPVADVAAVILDLLEAPRVTADAAEHVGATDDWQGRKRASLLAMWVRSAVDNSTRLANSSASDLAVILNRMERWYASVPAANRERCQLLAWLAWGNEACVRVWCQLLKHDPPQHEEGVREVFEPLFRRPDPPVSVLFPTLLEAISELGLATAILDLSNYFYRQKQTRPHPASSRLQPLSQLLANVTQQLLRVEAEPLSAGFPPEQLSRVINESVGLISALCDFLALQGDRSMVGKLYPCLELRHRRVQVEAAYALATLSEQEGRDRLVALAKEPLVRRRVLAYCEPLGLLDQISPEYQDQAALAESELVLSLAHPQNLGLAPHSTRLLDQRTQNWPGYEEPVECFLFEFEYPFSDHPYRNVGIVGPVTHSFPAVLCELNVDDLYAVFAGWHVSHPEIYALEAAQFGPQQAGTLARLKRRLTDQGVEQIEPLLLGHFFDEWVLTGRGRRGEDDGWVVAGPNEPLWLPDLGGFQNFDAGLVWFFWIGRTLLRQFNAAPESAP